MSAKTLDAYDEQEAIEIAKHHVSIFYLEAVRKLAGLMECLYSEDQIQLSWRKLAVGTSG